MKTEFEEGRRAFKFFPKVYGHPTVKEALQKLQHDKCCFCEAYVSAVSFGDVEHFRPKGGYQVETKSKLVRPGYFWLVYDFSNLFFACEKCNQNFKRNFFPLENEDGRARSHLDDISLEKNLILHPELNDPALHIKFNQEVAVPRNHSEMGKKTIYRTGLNRKELLEDRLRLLVSLKLKAPIARDIDYPLSPVYRQYFQSISQSNHPYSLMVRDNFPDLCRP